MWIVLLWTELRVRPPAFMNSILPFLVDRPCMNTQVLLSPWMAPRRLTTQTLPCLAKTQGVTPGP